MEMEKLIKRERKETAEAAKASVEMFINKIENKIY